MKVQMTSKQRVQATIAHQQPDRVPVNYLYNTEIDLRLKEHYGLGCKDDEGLRQALGVDFRGVGAPYVGPKLHPDVPGRHIDIWGIRRRWVEHEAGGYWDFCDWPLQDATLEEVEAWPLPNPDHFDYSAIVRQCETAQGLLHRGGQPRRRRHHQLQQHAADDGAGAGRPGDRRAGGPAADRPADRDHAGGHPPHAGGGGGRIDMLWLGEDLGTQIGPMISLDLFRRHIRPRHQLFVDLAKQWGIPVMMHSCGSSSWAFEDFIEMGIGVVDTLQPEAANMAPAYLKKRFGERLAFHGMISTAGPLAYGSVAEVVDNVRQTLATMMPGGGYMLAPTHQIQSNSPTENVVAMYETARQYGTY